MFKSYLIFLFLTLIDGYLLENNILKKSFVTAPQVKTDADALKYLIKYGYDLPGGCDDGKINETKPLRQSTFQTIVEHFQTMFNLPISGKLDHVTTTLMKKPRCGLEDFVAVCHATRPWFNTTLKWRLYNEIPTFTRDKIRSQIRQAFDDWARYIPLKFREATVHEKAEFNISFQAGEHGDHLPFDGPGGNIAHAFSPKNGNIHFDATETWTDKYDGSGYNLRLVAAHAIGHVLGLSHSHNSKSLMYPFYQLFQPNELLSKEDQDTIRAFYGTNEINQRTTFSSNKTTMAQKKHRKTKVTTRKSKTTKPQASPHDRCVRYLDVAFGGGPDKSLYTLDHDLVWRYHSDTGHWDTKGSPINIMFPSSETHITAGVFSPKTKKTYLFKDYRVWRYTDKNKLDAGFPKRISGTGTPNNPVAALYDKNYIWLFKDGLLFKINEDNLEYESNQSTKRINELFPSIPKNIRSAFTFNEKHYFFTEPDRKVYIFDIENRRLEPGYPKPMSTGWFACKGH